MTTIGMGEGELKDLGAGDCGSEATAPEGDRGGRGLVLPEEVVADLAAQLVKRARAGEPVALTGRDGLLSGLIGQVLQAGLGLELEEHLAAGGEGNGRERAPGKDAEDRGGAGAGECAAGPGRDVRAGAGAEGLEADVGDQRSGDQLVCLGDERAGYRPAPGPVDGC